MRQSDPTKESGKLVLHHYTSDSLVDFSRAEHDPDCPGCEIERLREALGKLSELPVVVNNEYAYRVTEIAHRALERR